MAAAGGHLGGDNHPEQGLWVTRLLLRTVRMTTQGSELCSSQDQKAGEQLRQPYSDLLGGEVITLRDIWSPYLLQRYWRQPRHRNNLSVHRRMSGWRSCEVTHKRVHAVKCMHLLHLVARLCLTLEALGPVACHAPLSVGFPARVGFHFLLQGILWI